MKKIILFTLAFFVLAGITSAQEETISNNFGAGFHLNQYQRDFGIGLNLTSPYFAYDKIAIRVRANLMFNEHVQENETTWTPYSNVSLGMIGVARTINDFMRLYGEGGVVLLFPSDDFSSENVEFGGYGLFGFEFYVFNKMNYFIEIGGIGTGAKADVIENIPIYSNGLIIGTGLRVHF